VVAIGINEYANPNYNLRYAAADAQAFSAELKNSLEALHQYSQVQTLLLLDREATRENLLTVLGRLAGHNQLANNTSEQLQSIPPLQPEDTLFIFAAGHGIAYGGRFYLVPHDLGYKGTQASLNPVGLKIILDHSVSDEDLDRAFEDIDAGHVVLITDACNSGQMLAQTEKRRGPMNTRGLAQLAYEKGMYVLASSQDYQSALEVERLRHGMLTYALLFEGLKTAPVQAGGDELTVRDWLDYGIRRVPQLHLEFLQASRQKLRGFGGNDVAGNLSQEEMASVQHPRGYYRREPEKTPFLVGRFSVASGRPQP
jgi:uncharacterized caspase-like protein